MTTVLVTLWLAITPYAYERVEVLVDQQPTDYNCFEVIEHISSRQHERYFYDKKLIMAYQCREITTS